MITVRQINNGHIEKAKKTDNAQIRYSLLAHVLKYFFHAEVGLLLICS